MENILINILTRSGSRESYFNILDRSIKKQSYKNIRHIVSNDNPYNKYLKNRQDVINLLPKSYHKHLGKCFYNLYLNKLSKKVKDGWVIILDDDSCIIDKNFIKNLANICEKSNPNDILIYKCYLGERSYTQPPKYHFKFKNIMIGKIDMACFCVHYSVFKNFKFKPYCAGDFNFLNDIVQSKQYNFKFVNINIGVHANYRGAKHGN
jgi:hypothetical protein